MKLMQGSQLLLSTQSELLPLANVTNEALKTRGTN